MLRWNADLGTAQQTELPPWWVNTRGVDCAGALLESVKLHDAVSPPAQVELIDQQLRDDIFQLKCDIFTFDDNADSVDGQERPTRSPIPQTERDRIRRARAAVNPFEQIGRSVFINRAAVKLASLDAALGFVLSENNPQRQGASKRLLFADLCGGPGGFSEYLIWRLSGLARGQCCENSNEAVRGFGLTLKGRHDDFQQEHWWSVKELKGELPFTAVYGPSEMSTGDITVEENRQTFINAVREAAPQGCGLVLGDGGFDMSGKEERQETLISKLLAYEFALAITLLGPGGNFVCKLFDVATPTTASLLYVLSTFFEKISIIKPVTSRPANGERYVVGLGFLHVSQCCIDEAVALLSQAGAAVDGDSGEALPDFGGVLPSASLPSDFIVFLRSINNEIATRQKAALVRLLGEARDPAMGGPTGITAASALRIANDCSRLWHLPPVAPPPPASGSLAAPAPYTRPPGLANGRPASGGCFSRNDVASSVDDWRAQKKPTAVSAPTQRPSGLSNGLPLFNNSNNASNFFSSKNSNNGRWKVRGLADSVANWRQSPAQ